MVQRGEFGLEEMDIGYPDLGLGDPLLCPEASAFALKAGSEEDMTGGPTH